MPRSDPASSDAILAPSNTGEISTHGIGPQGIDCGGRFLDLSTPVIMGVLNITPDSFSDGGRWFRGGRAELDSLLNHAAAMIAAGAQILDVGGESTRPGAEAVSEAEEIDRVVPVVEALSAEFDSIISVDTSTPAVMEQSAAVGARILNDVRALEREGALECAAALNLPVCLMHMQGAPQTMQDDPHYDNPTQEVASYLEQRAQACLDAGIAKDQIVLDPGFGFGKSLEHNLQLLANLSGLGELGYPLLVGLSRKSLIAKITGREVGERLAGSLALALMAAQQGASILRVHDVVETADVLKVLQAVRTQ